MSKLQDQKSIRFPQGTVREYSWNILQIVLFAGALLVNLVIPSKHMVDLFPYRVVLGIFLLIFLVQIIVSFSNNNVKRKIQYSAQFYCALGVAFILWDLLTEKFNLLPLPFFPSLAQIIQVMVEDAATLLLSTGYSIRLLVIGFVIGLLLGLITGVLMGWYKKWHYWLFPGIKIIGVIPATAWIPIVMIIFPSSFYASIALIVISVWFPVAFMTSTGIANIPNSYFEAAKTLGAGEKFLIFKVGIPGAMPSIITGVYMATALAFTTLVVSEMIGAKAGLGWYINWAKGWSNYAKVYASIIIMAVVFSLLMALFFKIRDRLLIWQKGLLK
ncbi:ABC transporter permease [Bacillota bacterium LX-D]|nr:ABC transporter permease [Bacillota bacterium LX-D]